jgi:hypothetical protein
LSPIGTHPVLQALISATVAALTVIAIIGALTGDAFYGVLFTGFFVMGGARSAAVWLYHRIPHDSHDVESINRWELVALSGAWAFASEIRRPDGSMSGVLR